MWSTLMSRGGSRELTGIPGKVIGVLAVAIALYHLYIFSSGTYEIFPHRSIHLGSILAICFLTYSFSAKNTRKFFLLDIFLALVSLTIMVYLVVNAERLIYDRVMFVPGSLTSLELIMGVVLIIILFEASRRAMGPILGFLTFLFLLHAYLGPYLGGILRHAGFSISQIIDLTVFTEQGIYTIPIGICSTYIIMFLIFAGLVQISGATDFFRDLALSLAGRAKGGPAKVAVIGSAFIGSITGSSAANVAITGSVTIPMMKKAGFEPYFAGAVEAAASKGGHILPPVMAGTIFIMAEFLGVTYWSICIAAFIPALLYFWGVFLQVHFYASRRHTAQVEETEIPSLWQTLKKGGQHFAPFVVLVGLLANGYSPIWSALWSLPVAIAASWVRKDTRIGIKKLFIGLRFSVMAIRLVMLATALSGIIMGVVMGTGLGTKLMTSVAAVSEDRLIVALAISAGVAFLLGLSLSMVAAYILTAILIVPAAVSLGVTPLAAHLWAFYFGSLAALTPPVGATFYQAAALAGSPPFKTGWAATRLAIAAFIVPIFFVYYPSMLLIGSITDTIIVVIIAVIAIGCIALALEGWLIGQLNLLQRILLIVAGCLLLVIKPAVVVTSGVLIASALFWHWWEHRHEALQEKHR